VVVVARSGLGTINHTLLTLAALRAAGAEVAGVIMNGPPHPANADAIAHFGRVPVLAQVPMLDDLSPQGLKNACARYIP
jgi:dethiobiotin synthetase